ncbi:hypothetical protein TRFO_23503 [Tritrichomonas foetus]|uniref:Importin N-terminal domain-containing protein n=1 Tax=Tritrichomonas foetus TaxID=1144522 RepID=A0A1J4KFL6_9EUKA|nr:hypothetical protein TRFO_23503 [Tritrichomonas foetus]|eukprot:OHT08133.1 hypothetical protein TRFO_23503 [Tritrichomonas foetus]
MSISFTADTITNAITAFYTSNDDAIRMNAEKFLLLWKESEKALELACQLLQTENMPQIMFISTIVLQNAIRNKWNTFDQKIINIVISTIIPIINENINIIYQPHIFKLILLISDIITLDFNYFPLISQLNTCVHLCVISLLYEHVNSQEPFLSKLNLLSSAKLNLSRRVPFSIQLLNQYDVSPDWLELHYQLLIFFNCDFPLFFPLLEKLKSAATQIECLNKLLKVCSLILSNNMEYTTDEEQDYFKNIIEVTISMANLVLNSHEFSHEMVNDISFDMVNENYYLFVINAWSSIFNITDFFHECGHGDVLIELLGQFYQVLPKITLPNSVFLQFLVDFCDFLSDKHIAPDIEPCIIVFIKYLSTMINQNISFYKTNHISYCFRNLQREFPELYNSYLINQINQIMMTSQASISNSGFNLENVKESIFFMVASTDEEFAIKFVEPLTSILIAMPNKPIETTLFFIRFVGIFSDSELLIPIVLEMFLNDDDNATCVIDSYSMKKSQFLIPYIPQLMSLVGQIRIQFSCNLVISLLRLTTVLTNEMELKHLSGFILSFITQYVQKSAKQHINTLCSSIQFLNNLITCSPNINSNSSFDYKSYYNTIYQSICSIIEPFILLDNIIFQETLCIYFKLVITLWEIPDLSFVINYFISSISTNPIQNHFSLFEHFIDLFPIPPIIEYVLNFDYMSNTEIAGYIIEYLINPLYKNWSEFGNAFHPQFLIGLLTIPNIITLNSSLELFTEISKNQISSEFSKAIISTILTGMTQFYYDLQIKKSVNIFHQLIFTNSLSSQDFSEILTQFFNPQIPNVLEFITSITNDSENEYLFEETMMLKNIVMFIKRTAQ